MFEVVSSCNWRLRGVLMLVVHRHKQSSFKDWTFWKFHGSLGRVKLPPSRRLLDLSLITPPIIPELIPSLLFFIYIIMELLFCSSS